MSSWKQFLRRIYKNKQNPVKEKILAVLTVLFSLFKANECKRLQIVSPFIPLTRTALLLLTQKKFSLVLRWLDLQSTLEHPTE